MNLQRSSTEGVSPGFLANWMLGDVLNLLGCLLTRQLPFQTLLATYYCFIDSCLVCQYCLYNVVRRPSVVVIEGLEQVPSPSGPAAAAVRKNNWRFNPNALVVLAMLVSGVAASGESTPGDAAGDSNVVGLMAAWGSSILYFTSRLPQM